MEISDVLKLLGGLALFLYGMNKMSEGLEEAAGNKLKKILERLTSNRFMGIIVGALITAVIQSSSATTVMTVGFVNSGLMKLEQAVWVIMGANIGTTITGQLVALDIGTIAPLIAFIGVIIIMIAKEQRMSCVGEIVTGLGVLFIGMKYMGDAMAPLRESQKFISIMTSFSNPFYGIMAGMIFTAIIQSSSASIGILQTLAVSGLIGFDGAVYVLFGQNIGTCITAIFASIGANKNAKRTTVIHLLFNIIGTCIFVPICIFLPITDIVASWTPDNIAGQIANMHTVFNIATTLVLAPFGIYLTKLAIKILPGEDEKEAKMQLKYVNEHNIGGTAIAISEIYHEVGHMLIIAMENVKDAFETIIQDTDKNLKIINEKEEYLDYLNTEITRYISKVSAYEVPEKDANKINTLFKITGDIERIGDHALNIAEYILIIEEKDIKLTSDAKRELLRLRNNILESLKAVTIVDASNLIEVLEKITASEEAIDEMCLEFRQNQIDRMNEKACTVEACVIYSELLTDVERISDHLMNIIEGCKRGNLTFKNKIS